MTDSDRLREIAEKLKKERPYQALVCLQIADKLENQPPSDEAETNEAIKKEVDKRFDDTYGPDMNKIYGFIQGAKWMQKQLNK